ncbi:hypothetical protein F5148DRAFT_1280749 [Russula earlei]|uniref:Uncharacterized protein n=1 Tax=Russula earlei TaxID=71964 RepID=A0ACC0UIF6_9AGAM|nr:hypothetical protein F5148DRAFT_1280749 [Russula earlei]
MSTQHKSSTGTGGLVKHQVYYLRDADVIFRAENTLFKVHKHFFMRESPRFRDMFRSPSIPCTDPPGSSDTNPVVLKDTSADSFAAFLWVFYNPKYSIYIADVDQWWDILNLAQRWEFEEVELLCLRELEKLPITAVEKIRRYQEFKLDRALLAESFAMLMLRVEPLSIEEGRLLGIDTSLQIAQAREASRSLNHGLGPSPGVDEQEFALIILKIFNIKVQSFDLLVIGSFDLMRMILKSYYRSRKTGHPPFQEQEQQQQQHKPKQQHQRPKQQQHPSPNDQRQTGSIIDDNVTGSHKKEKSK